MGALALAVALSLHVSSAASLLLVLTSLHAHVEAPDRRLLAVKAARVAVYVIVCACQAVVVAVSLLVGGGFDLDHSSDCAALLAFASCTVLLAVRWRAHMSLRTTTAACLAALQASLLLALAVVASGDRTIEGGGEDASMESMARLAVHSAQAALLLALVVGEVTLQQHLALHGDEADQGEPLLGTAAASAAAAAAPGSPRAADLGGRAVLGTLRYLWPSDGGGRARVCACFALLALERGVNLALPIAYKNMVEALGSVADARAAADDEAAPQRTPLLLRGLLGAAAAAPALTLFWRAFYPWAALYLGVVWLRGGASGEGLLANVRELLYIPLSQAAFRRVSSDVFGHLLALDLEWHTHRRTGAVLRILDRGTSSIQTLVEVVLFSVVAQAADVVAACAYLAAAMAPWAAAVVGVTVAAYVPLTLAITERRGRVRKVMNALDNAREGRATDVLLNYEAVKVCGNEGREVDAYDEATRRYQAAEYWQSVFLVLLAMAQDGVVWVGLAAGLVGCVAGVAAGRLSVGDAVLFVTLVQQLHAPLAAAGSYYRQVQKALLDMENMFELLGTAPQVKDVPGALPLVVKAGHVAFERVVFGYDASAPVLRGVSLAAPGGSTLAVVGPTGSGKSSLLRLLMRLYDPQEGRVVVDGQDIRGVTQDSLRAAIAAVPQDAVLFNADVMSNIRYSRLDASDAEVYDAARVAHIHDTVSAFPQGYRTLVGERGLRLSGGEKQRVAFARAVLKAPPILVLDEATSSLDTLTEHLISASLAELRAQRTTIIVAHRLSTVMDAGCIVVLHHGKVAECGNHSELLAAGGLYASMWQRQQSERADTPLDLQLAPSEPLPPLPPPPPRRRPSGGGGATARATLSLRQQRLQRADTGDSDAPLRSLTPDSVSEVQELPLRREAASAAVAPPGAAGLHDPVTGEGSHCLKP